MDASGDRHARRLLATVSHLSPQASHAALLQASATSRSRDTRKDACVLGADDSLPELAVRIIRQEFAELDPQLPKMMQVISESGADELWHKHGTFKEHLFGVWRVMKLWGMSQDMCRMALLHSSYSNSYVKMALFKPDVDRSVVRDLAGGPAEELVHLFCVVPRQHLIFEKLLPMRTIPADGVVVKHIRTGENLRLSPQQCADFLLATVADYSEQWFGWQDELFGNDDAGLRFTPERYEAGALWPGDNKPGLYLHAMSKLAVMAATAKPRVHLPPVFAHCTQVLSSVAEKEARDLYWDVQCNKTKRVHAKAAEAALLKAIALNPFVAEPRALLAQVYIRDGKFDQSHKHARDALQLLLDWGTPWDKRLPWEAWVSWCRVLMEHSRRKQWPSDKEPFGIISLGVVGQGVGKH